MVSDLLVNFDEGSWKVENSQLEPSEVSIVVQAVTSKLRSSATKEEAVETVRRGSRNVEITVGSVWDGADKVKVHAWILSVREGRKQRCMTTWILRKR